MGPRTSDGYLAWGAHADHMDEWWAKKESASRSMAVQSRERREPEATAWHVANLKLCENGRLLNRRLHLLMLLRARAYGVV